MTKRAPEPTSTDLANWRKLVRLARQSAADPAAPCGDLAKVEKAAKRSVVLGTLNAENPCVQLVRLVRQFVASTTRQRRELGPRILEVADQVERRLKPSVQQPPAQDPPARRLRADIDG